MDARLYTLPAPRPSRNQWSPSQAWRALAHSEAMLDARAEQLVLDLYGRRDQVRLAEMSACVYPARDRLLRAVTVEPLTGGRKPQAFYSTCHMVIGLEVLT